MIYTLAVAVIAFSSCGAGGKSVDEEHAVGQSDSQFIASYPFVDTAADTLFDPADNMERFYAKLRQLDTLCFSRRGGEADSLRAAEAAGSPDDRQNDGARRVNILHFGDSHIQGGMLSDVIMRHLHNRFGNAGRGMIVPHKLSGSNEPRDYAIQALPGCCGEWSSSRIVNARPNLPLGISGVSVQSSRAENRLRLCTFNYDSDTLDYRFNKVRIFHGKYAPIIEADENLSAGLSAPDIIYDFNTDIDLVATVDTLELHTYADNRFAKGPIYGFSLENGRDGVLYHALGVNSACFLHWGRQEEVIRQSTALEPDLIILSMGSNEASGSHFLDDVFYREIDRFVSSLRSANPDAAILLTAPAQAFRQGEPNPNFESVSRTLKRYAAENGVAFIDLYTATGGERSALCWDEYNLMARDKIHYTEEGYRIQGLLIYNALYNAYIGHAPTAQ
ncbi:MAG: hypothetical protein J1E79_04410 [Rikenella sp.]|nr:hypothetical protein [Rikenella sp.]